MDTDLRSKKEEAYNLQAKDEVGLKSLPLKWAKMAQYYLFLKFLATEHCFGNYWRSTTFSGTRAW